MATAEKSLIATVRGVRVTSNDTSEGADDIATLRARIDAVDVTIMKLWMERAALSRQVGATRMASGGTRIVLALEHEVLARFSQELGKQGARLAMLLLEVGRGTLSQGRTRS